MVSDNLVSGYLAHVLSRMSWPQGSWQRPVSPYCVMDKRQKRIGGRKNPVQNICKHFPSHLLSLGRVHSLKDSTTSKKKVQPAGDEVSSSQACRAYFTLWFHNFCFSFRRRVSLKHSCLGPERVWCLKISAGLLNHEDMVNTSIKWGRYKRVLSCKGKIRCIHSNSRLNSYLHFDIVSYGPFT